MLFAWSALAQNDDFQPGQAPPQPQPQPQQQLEGLRPQVNEDLAGEMEESRQVREEQAAPAAGAQPSGDVLVLKNGRTMDGVQILRENPIAYVVQIVEGVEMEIDRSQVESVTYDDIDPMVERLRRAREGTRGEQDEIPAQRLDPQFNEKLNDPFRAAIEYRNMDVVAIAGELGKRKEVTIEVSDGVRDLPPAERQWSLVQEPGVTLMQVFRKPFEERFKKLRVRYDFDKIRILTQAEAEEMAAEAGGNATGPGADAPSPQQ